MRLLPVLTTLMFAILWGGAAWASPFDGWSLEQVKSDPRYHLIEDCPVAVPIRVDGPFCCGYHRYRDSWVGYIELGRDYVVFDHAGNSLTVNSNGIAKWAVDAIDYVEERGVFEEFYGAFDAYGMY